MVQALSDLSSALKSAEYTPLSDSEILQRAENQYKNLYEQQVLGAKQVYDAGELGYEKQIQQLGVSYGRQIAQIQEQTKQTASEADRNALTRGMQRSSYNLATLSNIHLSGDKAQTSAGETRAMAEANIAAERTLKAQQLAEQLASAQTAYQTNILSYADQLRDKEAQKALEANKYYNDLTIAMYEYQSQADQKQREYDQWLMEFNENVRQFEASQALKIEQMNATATKSSSGSSSKKKEKEATPLSNVSSTSVTKSSLKS